MSSPANHACYSVGYQGRRADELCRALAARGVELLIDVREKPWSRRPEFCKQALANALQRHGVAYAHVQAAGNPFRAKPGEANDPSHWREAYAQHLAQHPEVLDLLARLMDGKCTAVLCFEADPAACHRTVVLELLQRRDPGLAVEPL